MSEDPIDDISLRGPGPLRCPKCRTAMSPVTLAGTEVDRCNGCGGIWFDLLEHEDLKGTPGAETLDSGDPATGQRYDQVGLVRCPVDGVPMVRMVDKAQPTLWLESCPVCYGTFFDAGEFREFTEDSLRDMVHRRRRHRPL
jgi:Zn-finger nucleic acid-binding protein